MLKGQSCVFLIVIALSEPRQLYIQILLNPEVYSPFLKHVTAYASFIKYTNRIANTNAAKKIDALILLVTNNAIIIPELKAI